MANIVALIVALLSFYDYSCLGLWWGSLYKDFAKHLGPACLDIIEAKVWVAVKELKLSYYIGETLVFTIYTQYAT